MKRFVGIREERSLLGKSGPRWEDNIKMGDKKKQKSENGAAGTATDYGLDN
jgi:hypothetical protein